MATKIELTELELSMLERNLRGEFFPPEQTKEENMAFKSVIDKAEALMHEEKAYEESGSNVMLWFYNRYKAQQATE